jgi:hypothetical protein
VAFNGAAVLNTMPAAGHITMLAAPSSPLEVRCLRLMRVSQHSKGQWQQLRATQFDASNVQCW